MFNIFKIFKRKPKITREQELLVEYEAGKILQVGNGKNNKEYFQSLENDQPQQNE